MAASPQDVRRTDLHAVVDMGSNAIRFSITDLNPTTARTLTTVYHHRAPISLHDGQYIAGNSKRQTLSDATIALVTSALASFKRTCSSFDVPPENITVVATEATRTAPNAKELLSVIKKGTDWDVRLLSKDEEARFGALGVAASVPACRGLVLDLGGGSIQLSWVRTHDDGRLPDMSDQVVSLPYGAAALMKRLEGRERELWCPLRAEVEGELKTALHTLDIPEDLKVRGGVSMYLSGGGLRGWGYFLMASEADGPYPIPMINGYSVSWDDFVDESRVARIIKKQKEKFSKSDLSRERHSKRTKVDQEEQDQPTGTNHTWYLSPTHVSAQCNHPHCQCPHQCHPDYRSTNWPSHLLCRWRAHRPPIFDNQRRNTHSKPPHNCCSCFFILAGLANSNIPNIADHSPPHVSFLN